uniref:Sulfatase N-terminal domain-containing protein n=1 Tax=Echeneis naucrates TaxID=173247 RepID=A0A665XG00_ECHNA
MQAAAAAALALSALSVLLCPDFLCALRSPKPNQSDEAEPKQKNPPHIIFILTDDQGFNDIGYHNPNIKTPTLDKLAAEGVRLENYYVQPICTPSRSQLITGRYQIHTGLQHSIIRPSQPSCLPSNMDTLPERLREAGYTTHMVGKWHLGFYRRACLPTRKGFDTFFGSLTGSVDYYSYGSCDGPGLCGYDLHDDEGVAWGQEGKYSTTLFTQRARKILEIHDPADRPLFLLFSLQAVHTPLQPPKPYIYPYRDMANVARRKFAAMVSTVDEAVRNLTYALRKYGYYKNSVIIYSTDNGAQPFTGGSNWPLRGRKGTYWEGGVRGVAFVHSPLLKRRRRISKDLLHITDWFPTLVSLAGGNISQSRGLDGFDVWPTISEGKESPRQEILHNIDPLHKPPVQTAAWDAGTEQVHTAKRPTFKKPKKTKTKILREKPKQKSAFQLKTTKKPQIFSHRVAKLKPKPVPKPQTKAYSQHQFLSHFRPHQKSQSSGDLPPSAMLHLKSQPKVRPILRSKKSKRASSWKHNLELSWSGTPQPKTKTQFRLHFKSKSRRTSSQYQNTSQLMTPPPQIPLSVGHIGTGCHQSRRLEAANRRSGSWRLGPPPGSPHAAWSLVEPRTHPLVFPRILRPQRHLAVQHRPRPVRAAGPVGPEARCGPTAAGPSRLLQPDGRAGLLPARRPQSQSRRARRRLGALGGRGRGRGKQISRRVQERQEQQEEEEEDKVPAVQAEVVLPETEHQDDVQPDLRSVCYTVTHENQLEAFPKHVHSLAPLCSSKYKRANKQTVSSCYLELR